MKDNEIFPLFDFNSIIDINLSIVHLIREEYYSSKYFINLDDEYFIKCLLTTMGDHDVIKSIIQSKYEDRIESLYKDFLNDEKLPNYFVEFPLARLFRIVSDTGYVKPAVLCSSQMEKEYIQTKYPESKIIYFNGQKININGKYDCYYTAVLDDINTKIDKPSKIQFKILRFNYNLEDKDGIELLKFDKIQDYLLDNSFGLIDPYTDIVIPDRESEDNTNGNVI